MKVFLGGTIKSNWRSSVIPQLKIEYFNPVKDVWNEEIANQVRFERKNADYCLYVITPKMQEGKALEEIRQEASVRPDRIIFTYLLVDDNAHFSEETLQKLIQLQKEVIANGAIYFESIEETVKYLNSINDSKRKLQNTKGYTNCFISYGRRHSLHFARTLADDLKKSGFSTWFDMNDIPLAVDFQEQIDEGIKNADNFLFIISPHSVKSEYCLKEVILALRYGKRIIPLLHIEPSDCWDNMHHEIGKRNWIYTRQLVDDSKPHSEWQFIDSYDKGFNNLISILKLHDEYIRLHTSILHLATEWDKNQRKTEYLLVGADRLDAEKWLLQKEFLGKDGKPTQSPCECTELQAEYICESKKNGENLLTDVFVTYSSENLHEQKRIIKAISRFAITCWIHSDDIKKGEDFGSAIISGVEQASSMIFFLSKESITSEYCLKELRHALLCNKRIIPVLLEKIDSVKIPENIRNLQYIDFSQALKTTDSKSEEIPVKLADKIEREVEKRREKTNFEKKIDELVRELQADNSYYHQHKILLVQALKWERQNRNNSILLRGFNLENAKAWLTLSENKKLKATSLHKKYIHESELKVGTLRSEVFISYSRKDSDFARKLNEQLQLSGKTTWFDQESISTGVDFGAEIKKGILQSDNFLFIISPDSIISPYCVDETEFAVNNKKRIITLLCRNLETEKLPEQLSNIQWIDFANKDLNYCFGQLLRTLDIDRQHVELHTKYALRAEEWKTHNFAKDLLLHGAEYIVAQEWLNNSTKDVHKNPPATSLQINYIKESQNHLDALARKEKKTIQNLRILLVAAGVGLIIAIFFSIVAYQSKEKAKEESNKAKKALNNYINNEMQKVKFNLVLKQKDIAIEILKNLQKIDSQNFIINTKLDSLNKIAK